MNQTDEKILPWYRQFWFWFVFGPLIFIIVLCMFTVTMAFHFADDVVTDNYYKTGLMINQTLKQDERAKALGLKAAIKFDQLTGEVFVSMKGNSTFPKELLLFLDNPAKSVKDQQVLLKEISDGAYRGELISPAQFSWYLSIVPESDIKKRKEAEWLLSGTIDFAKTAETTLQSRVDYKSAE